MKIRAYQFALGFAVAICLSFATALAYVLLPRFHSAQERSSQDPVLARGPDRATATDQGPDLAAAGAEPPLAPIQLTPRRLQEIGVTTAVAELKVVSQQLSVPGNAVCSVLSPTV